MDFFQQLRDIQKKERNTGTLSEIDDSFYTDASNYLQELLKTVNNNPLSLEAYQLRDAQRITTEICERREFKLVSTAVTNVEKSHDLFKGHKDDSELYDVIPYNTTPEEEEFYRKIVDMIVDHRENLMEKIVINNNNETKIGFKPKKTVETKENTVNIPSENEVSDSDVSEEPVIEEPKKPSINKPPMLDEAQIAMMFGQAPDDVLVDENNNPVKPVKKDITTPFKGPKPPVEDTVSLQNDSSETIIEPKTDESKQEEATQEIISTEETNETKNEITQLNYNDIELVEFKEEITTDILDENEKTYGPFLVDDVALLPKSLVVILENNNVIDIIK